MWMLSPTDFIKRFNKEDIEMTELERLQKEVEDLKAEMSMDKSVLKAREEMITRMRKENEELQWMLEALLPLDENLLKLAEAAEIGTSTLGNMVADGEFFLSGGNLPRWTVDLGEDGKFSIPASLYARDKYEVEKAAE